MNSCHQMRTFALPQVLTALCKEHDGDPKVTVEDIARRLGLELVADTEVQQQGGEITHCTTKKNHEAIPNM